MSIKFDGHVLRDARMAPANAKTTATAQSNVPDDTTWDLSAFSAVFQAAWGSYPVRPAFLQYRSAIVEGRENQSEEYLVFAAQDANLGVWITEENEDVVEKEPLFHWTRNDPEMTRFRWSGQAQRWTPIKGSPPQNMGKMEIGQTYTAKSVPRNLIVNQLLSGTDIDQPELYDQFAHVRIGTQPDALSKPILDDIDGDYRGILIVADFVLQGGEFDFSISSPPYAGIIGQNSGVIGWNPTFAKEYVGQTIWFISTNFQTESDGFLGFLEDADEDPLFVTPVPYDGERPLIRIGNRKWMACVYAQNDAEQASIAVPSGSVCVSLTTGKLKFSSMDILKAKKGRAKAPNPMVDSLYVGAKVFCDGVSLNSVAQPLRKAGLVENGKIPRANPLPGLGTCGYRLAEDFTGRKPNTQDNYHRAYESGLVREIEGCGDTFVYSKGKPVAKMQIVDTEEDLPRFPFLCRSGTAYVSKGTDTLGSKLMLHPKDSVKRLGEDILFQQSELPLAQYAHRVQMFSRKTEPYFLRGNEEISCVINGVLYTWEASSLTQGVVFAEGDEQAFSAKEIAENMNLVFGSRVSATRGRLSILGLNTTLGYIEVLPGLAGRLNLTGTSALGFNPFWRVEYPIPNNIIQYSNEDTNWLVDTGSVLGMFRSRLNLSGNNDLYTDIKAQGRIENAKLSEISASPFVFLQQIPLEDEPGLEGYDGVFFEARNGLYKTPLVPFENIQYLFEDRRIRWLDRYIYGKRFMGELVQFYLERNGIVSDTLHPALQGKLMASFQGERFHALEEGEDYRLEQDGNTGMVTLTEVMGSVALIDGADGSFTANSSSLYDATYLTPQLDQLSIGQRLKILNSAAKGHYHIASIEADHINVTPPFAHDSGDVPVSWEVYDMKTEDEIEKQIIADRFYTRFKHILSEPFIIVRMRLVGSILAQQSTVLFADVGDDFDKERSVYVQFGLEKDATKLQVIALNSVDLGIIAENGLVIDISDTSFQAGSFLLRVGTEVYPSTDTTKLAMVDSFTDTQDPLYDPEKIECLRDTGALRFGTAILKAQQDATVVYTQGFSTVTEGTAQVNVRTGELRLSQIDVDREARYGSVNVFWAAKMFTEAPTKDVQCNPVAGAFVFEEPLLEGDMVEVRYYQSDMAGALAVDDDGNSPLIHEFLPLYVRGEICERIDKRRYRFNLQNKLLHRDVEPVVYVGPEMQNYGGIQTMTINYDECIIYFSSDVDSSKTVKATFAVLECFGGELSFTVSTPPVYRPPFRLEGNINSFLLQGNRVGDMQSGMLMRIGMSHHYIQSVVYDTRADLSTVTIFPPTPARGAGSSAPGNDAMSLITSHPIAHNVNGLSVQSAKGFLVSLEDYYAAHQPIPVEVGSIYWESVTKGQTDIVIHADVSMIEPGHLIEIHGYPHSIVNVERLSDGNRTRLSFVPPVHGNMSFVEDVRNVMLTFRPIYPPGKVPYIGVGPFLTDEDFELILWKNGVPGRTLQPFDEYQFDANTGSVTFNPNVLDFVKPDEKLTLARTAMKKAQPIFRDGVMITPRIRAEFRHGTIPDEKNRLLQADLIASYTYHAPDSWYYRAVSMAEYAVQAQTDIEQRATQGDSAFGSSLGSASGTKNYENGVVGVLAQLRDLYDQDRAARQYLNFYNKVVVGFEQIQETVQGLVVGDRDGRFKYNIRTTHGYTPKGFENGVTGRLNPRFVWADVFGKYANATVADFIVNASDRLVQPWSGTLDVSALDLEGDTLNPFLVQFLIEEQKSLIENDLDDVVLTGLGRPKIERKGMGLRFSFPGVFETMAQPHPFSRVYPEKAIAFTTTMPGLEADALNGDFGKYSFLRLGYNEGTEKFEIQSTYLREIGDISNPSMGIIKNIQDIQTQLRSARARIWKYSEFGFPELDSILGSDFENNPRPAVIATPLPISQLPINLETGTPDVEKLATTMGDDGLPDLNTGDWQLHTPPFASGMKLRFGRTTGEFISVAYEGNSMAFGGYSPLFVEDVIGGIILTFKDVDGNSITNGQLLLEMQEEAAGTVISFARGDTVAQDLNVADEPLDIDDVSLEDITDVGDKIPNYRNGFDIGYNKRKGYYRDVSLPSAFDPSIWPLKEITGQNTPQPGTRIESHVDFIQASVDPVIVPALKGEPTNDSGDYTLPYLASQLTEIDVLREMMSVCANILLIDGPTGLASHDWLSVYPDEILANDGQISEYGVLVSDVEMSPSSSPYIPNSGIGNLRPYDLLFIECATNSSFSHAGATGIHSVGGVTELEDGSYAIEPPRFVTPTQNMTIDVRIENLIAWTGFDVGYTKGIQVWETIEESGPQTTWRTHTAFRLSSFVASISFMGLGSTFQNCPSGYIELRIMNRPLDLGNVSQGDGDEITHIRIVKSGGSYVLEIYDPFGVLIEEVFLHDVIFSDVDITLVTVHEANEDLTANPVERGMWFDFSNYPEVFVDPNTTPSGLPSQTFTTGVNANGESLYHDFLLTIDVVTNDVSIMEDRLTLQTAFDVRGAQPQGATHPISNMSMETKLTIRDTFIELTDANGNSTGAVASTINHIDQVNDGEPFVFLAASSLVSNGLHDVGFFDDNNSIGMLRTPSFWGQGNVPVSNTHAITFSVAPSSELHQTGLICSGTGLIGAEDNGVLYHEDRILMTDPFDVSKIERGDTVVVPSGHTAGTYLIKQAVSATQQEGVHLVNEMNLQATDAWYDLSFPVIKEVDLVNLKVQLLSWSTENHGFDTSGFRMFVLMKETWDGQQNTVVHPNMSASNLQYRVLYADVASFDDTTGEIQLNSLDLYDALGNSIASPNIYWQTMSGKRISGMRSLPLHVHMPSRNAYHLTGQNDPSTSAHGFQEIEIEGADGSTMSFSFSGGDLEALPSSGTSPNVNYVVAADGADAGTYQHQYILKGAPIELRLGTGIDLNSLWDVFSFTNEIRCFLPQTKITSTFWAEAGIFFEPSFPKPLRDVASSDASLVGAVSETGDPENTLANTEVGVRRSGDFVGNPAVWYNHTDFVVRRIRRFHDVQVGFSQGIDKLRYLYMKRTSTIQGMAGNTITIATTNLGSLTDPRVGVQSGCVIRVLDENQQVKCHGVIAQINTPQQVLLKMPGWLSEDDTVPELGDKIEIYLNTLAPHEQSNDQLLDLATDKVIFRQGHDLSAQLYGGKVEWQEEDTLEDSYVASRNILKDQDSTVDYLALGVEPGDILLVDPIGVVVDAASSVFGVDERGMRAFGDLGVPGRDEHQNGRPSPLDDNRGFYEVKIVTNSSLNVGYFDDSLYAGSEDNFAIYAEGEFDQAGNPMEFALYPTISHSFFGVEGQMDLRPTSLKGEDILETGDVRPNTFLDTPFSIGPFPYTILRPNAAFSSEAIQTILFHRERILSWVDALHFPQLLLKHGDYPTFQLDRHLYDMGRSNIPELGLGLLSNDVIYGFVGKVDVAPFLNDSDCMSVLDRLVLCQDEELDLTASPFIQGSPSYTRLSEGVGRPLLIDRIGDVLDNADQMRSIRAAWVVHRAHRTEGTAASIEIFKAENDRRHKRRDKTRNLS